MTIQWLRRRGETAAADAWSERIRVLATEHHRRRLATSASRWPLAHDCTRARARTAAHASDLSEVGSGRNAFCCGALG